jgi:hypothetical protein
MDALHTRGQLDHTSSMDIVLESMQLSSEGRLVEAWKKGE